jgi:hypothetical protein
MLNIEYSKNDYVNAILYAHEKGFLDKRIKNVYTSKQDRYYPRDYIEDFNYILSSGEVSVYMLSYGFNNHLHYTIELKELFNIDYNKIPKDIIEIFKRFNINLKSENKFEEICKLLTLKIRKT